MQAIILNVSCLFAKLITLNDISKSLFHHECDQTLTGNI